MANKRTPAEAAQPASLPYGTEYHTPVLCKAVVEGLVTDRDGLYVDGTLGGGGHTAALLDALSPSGRVVGIDQDADAIRVAHERLQHHVERGRLRIVHANFGDLENVLDQLDNPPVAGFLLDLGVSSHQLDQSHRGFSFSGEGDLDMRMDLRQGLSAREVINGWTEADLRRLFFEYGEEPRSARIARAVVAARPLETTREVAEVVRSVVYGPDAVKALARVFQAVRIAVNMELERLEQVLVSLTAILRPGARVAVISYHSLEDRRVKHVLRSGNLKGELVKDFYGNVLAPWRELTRKPVTPDPAEIAANPRARSARLRIAERTDVALSTTA